MSGTYKQQRRFRQDYNAGLNWKPFKHFTFRSELGFTWRFENTDQAWDKLATRNDNTGAGAPKSKFSRTDVRNWRNANTLTYDTKDAFSKGVVKLIAEGLLFFYNQFPYRFLYR